jgi:hypothetical protein
MICSICKQEKRNLNHFDVDGKEVLMCNECVIGDF